MREITIAKFMLTINNSSIFGVLDASEIKLSESSISFSELYRVSY
jgi:hypothetical protein